MAFPSSHLKVVDVAIMDSGAARLTATLTSKSAGAKEVVVLEKTVKLRGSTSFSVARGLDYP